MEVVDLPSPPRQIQLAEDGSIKEPPVYPEVDFAIPAPLNQQGPVKFEQNKYVLIDIIFLTAFNFIMKIVMVVTFVVINRNSARIESRDNVWVVAPSLLMIPNLWQYFFVRVEPFFSRNGLQESEMYGYMYLVLDIILIVAYPIFCFQNSSNTIAVFNSFIAALVGIMLIASDLVCLKILRKYNYFGYDPFDGASKLVLTHRNHTTPLSSKAIITESGPFRITIKNIAEDGTVLKGKFLVRRKVLRQFHTGNIGIIKRKKEVCEIEVDIEIPPNGYCFLIPSNHTLDSSEKIFTCSQFRCFGRDRGVKVSTTLSEIYTNIGLHFFLGEHDILDEVYIVDQ